MPGYRSKDLYEDVYNFDDINNRRKLDESGYPIRPKHHPRNVDERVRLPAVSGGRSLVTNLSNSRPVIDRHVQINKQTDWKEERTRLHVPRQPQKEPVHAEGAWSMRSSTARMTTVHAHQPECGDRRRKQHAGTYYEKEYVQLMEGVADKNIFEKSPQVIEYERKNKLKSGMNILPNAHAPNSPKRLDIPTVGPPEDVFSRRIREYEARTQSRKAVASINPPADIFTQRTTETRIPPCKMASPVCQSGDVYSERIRAYETRNQQRKPGSVYRKQDHRTARRDS